MILVIFLQKIRSILHCIPTLCHQLISNTCYSSPHTSATFCCLFTGTDLVVIKLILLPVLHRRKVRHHDIGSCLQPFLSSKRIHRPKCCRCRKKYLRQQNPDHSVISTLPAGSFENCVSWCGINGPIPTISGCNSFKNTRSSARSSVV